MVSLLTGLTAVLLSVYNINTSLSLDLGFRVDDLELCSGKENSVYTVYIHVGSALQHHSVQGSNEMEICRSQGQLSMSDDC